MGAIFAILFLLFLLAVGLIVIAAGIVGLVIRRKRRKAGKLFPGILTVVCACGGTRTDSCVLRRLDQFGWIL